MDANLTSDWGMAETDRSIVEVFRRESGRLGGFIRRRVPDAADAEDLLQEVFSELVEAARLPEPIEQVGAWLFRVARNRITDLFRRKSPEPFAETAHPGEDGEWLRFEDLLPSPDAGPEGAYLRGALIDAFEAALAELTPEQRDVFVAHEFDGRSFKELSTATGINVNTLLSRKHAAVRRLRERLQPVYDDLASL